MDWIWCFWCFLKNNNEQITIIFSIITLVLAIYGLNSWRKQINGINQIKLAKSLLSQIYLLKDLFINVRCSIYYNNEEGIVENKSSNKDKEAIRLRNRLLPITEALVKIQKDYYDAYVEWGLDNSSHLGKLKELYYEYIQAVETYIEYYEEKGLPEKIEAKKKVFSFKAKDEKDEFNNKLDNVVMDFDKWLRPKFQGYIKRSCIRLKKKIQRSL